MSTRWYPLYQRGNPQLRVFLPNFWMKLVKDTKMKQPPNVVLFHVSLQMTEHDVKNYLEKIYKVPVMDVKTKVYLGEFKQQEWKGYVVKEDDYKVAYVTLPKNESFTFPNLFGGEKDEAMQKDLKMLEENKKMYRRSQEKNKLRPGLPGWFSI